MRTLLREGLWIQHTDPEMEELTYLDYLVFKKCFEMKGWIRLVGELV